MMKFIIDGEHEFCDVHDAADYISENINEEEYDNMLDEVYPEIELFGASFSPSLVLERVDPIAYRCGFSDYQNSIYEDAKYDLERMDDGDEDYINGFTVEAVEVDAEIEVA